MLKRKVMLRTAVFFFSFAVAQGAAAAGLYKWVDRDGKVHYSETDPTGGESAKLNIQRPAPSPEPELPQGESIRGPDGNCLTVKCMADEMEADRHQREAGYARQRAENERATKKAAPKDGSIAESEKHWLRNQCLNGSLGPSTRDCDDYEKLRKYAEQRALDRELRSLQSKQPKYRY